MCHAIVVTHYTGKEYLQFVVIGHMQTHSLVMDCFLTHSHSHTRNSEREISRLLRPAKKCTSNAFGHLLQKFLSILDQNMNTFSPRVLGVQFQKCCLHTEFHRLNLNLKQLAPLGDWDCLVDLGMQFENEFSIDRFCNPVC